MRVLPMKLRCLIRDPLLTRSRDQHSMGPTDEGTKLSSLAKTNRVLDSILSACKKAATADGRRKFRGYSGCVAKQIHKLNIPYLERRRSDTSREQI